MKSPVFTPLRLVPREIDRSGRRGEEAVEVEGARPGRAPRIQARRRSLPQGAARCGTGPTSKIRRKFYIVKVNYPRY